jgi:hypothetical protein
VSRDPASIVHEADYWSALLDDVRELNDGVLAVASSITDLPIVILELLLATDPKAATEKAHRTIRGALVSVERMQPPIDRLIELATGRLIGLRAEAGLPPLGES